MTVAADGLSQKPSDEYLRIHIRANSNESIDQNIKYQVKDCLVKYLTPYIADCKSKRQAELLLKEDGSVELIRRAETPADYYATFDCFEIGKKLQK